MDGDPLQLVYLASFAVAGLVCLGSLRGLSLVEDTEVRAGLGWLLGLTGLWSLAHVAYLLPVGETLRYGFFVVGLTVGLAAVGPWLYFCSAYTGRTLHRHRGIRMTAVSVFLAIILVKVTNPYHGLYFTAYATTEPFAHLAIHHEPLHWVVMGLAYALAAVGIVMLLELFLEVSYDTRPLVVLVGITGLPVVFDLLGTTTTQMLAVTHSPLGVAAFAVGVLFVFIDRFQAVHLAGGTDHPVILLDTKGRVRDWNRSARELFPTIETAGRVPVEEVAPPLGDVVHGSSQLITLERGDTTRYYRVTTNPFSTDSSRLGTMVTLTDVSEREQYRRQVERQNERLQEFASIVSHDLRNPLSVATGRLELAMETGDLEHLDEVNDAHERMQVLIDDLLTLARSGMQIDETEPVDVADVARESWEMIEAGSAELSLEPSLSLTCEADPTRLRQLFENLYRNAIEHGGHDVTITVGPLDDMAGIFIEDDGPGIPEDIRDSVLEPGFTSTEAGTGFGLAIVNDIAKAHGWSIEITEGTDGGARFELRMPAGS